MNKLDEQTLGRILAEFRNQIGQTGSEVVPYLKASLRGTGYSYWSTNRISLVEKNQTSRPEIEILRAFSDFYRLTPWEYTVLLRAADYPPTEEQLHEMRLNVSPILAEIGVPSYVLNYRYELVLWNDAFAQLYDPAPPTFAGTMMREQLREDIENPREVWREEVNALTEGANSPAGNQSSLDSPLQLQVGMPYFLFLWSRQGRFRQQTAHEEWERVVDFVLVRFWRTVKPLIQPHWNLTPEGEPGEPEWLHNVIRRLSNLPAPDGQDFAERSQRTRALLGSDRRDKQVQLLRNRLYDRLFFRQGRLRFQWVNSEMEDARFTLVQHFPIEQSVTMPLPFRQPW